MTASKSIVLLGVNASFSHSSLALRYLAGCAAQAGWRPVLVECTLRDDPDQVVRRVLQENPGVLAATFYLFTREFAATVVGRVKALSPATLVVGGGPEFLGDNRDALRRMKGLDLVVRGEGELALAAILRARNDPDALARIPGVCMFHEGQYVDNGLARVVTSLDALPRPYARFAPSADKPFAHLETSRGCANRCAFCTSAGTGPVRTLSLERTRRELEALQAAGVGQVRLVDRTFNASPRRAVALLKLFREAFPAMRFHLEIDPACLTPSVLAALDRAPDGQLHIEAGLQSLHGEVLRAIRRRGGVARAVRGFATLCAMHHLQVHADLIAGLPGTTLKGVLADLERIARLAPAEIQLEVLKILPGTALAGEASERGICWPPRPPYAVRSTPDMSTDQIRKVRRLSVLVDRLYNTESLRPVVQRAVREVERFWSKLLGQFRSEKDLEAVRTLEGRFRFLDAFFGERYTACRHALQFAWMRKGLSARRGICRVEPVRNGIPAGARLVEGRADIPVARAYRLEAGRTYIFAYAAGRRHGRVGAVYVVE